MMVFTAKVKKRNILILFGVILAIILLTVLTGTKKKNTGDKVSTNTDRVTFLQNLGWTVEETAAEIQEVLIPAEESDVFSRYNELQKAQGYNLNEYAGKNVKRYVYEITNYPDQTGEYRATLLIYNDRVIGGDVASTEHTGTMHALKMP